MVVSIKIEIQTQGNAEVRDITPLVREGVSQAGISDGLCTVFVPGSTAGITTIEFEPGAVQDLKDAISRMAPEEMPYRHDARWGDGNGYAHVRAALLGSSFTLPVVDGAPVLGTWQQVVLIDFDNRPRSRNLIVQVMGE
jgi:secondary thiamine-phosphate synthase enzyme